jgi:hypothetical protein
MTEWRDEILEAEVRDQCRNLGMDEDSIGEGLAAAWDAGVFGAYEAPAPPGAPQCEADGVRNGPDGPGGTEHYWSCTAPGTVDVDGTLMCEDHAAEHGCRPQDDVRRA